MQIISITGTASGVGKTTVAQFLLKFLWGFSALKITTRHEGSNCPRHSECDVCETMKRPYTVTVDPLQINQMGKDTALFNNAGARKVVWLQAHSDHLQAGIEDALSRFGKTDSVIVEGNSFLHAHDADLSILVVTPREKKIKRSTVQILPKVDLVVINKYADDSEGDVIEARERLHQIGCYAPVYIINPRDEDFSQNKIFLKYIRDTIEQPAHTCR